MKKAIPCLIGAFYLSLGFAATALAAEYAYVVSYLEARPADKDKAAAMIREYAKASRKEAGSVRLEALERNGHPGQFAMLEVWADEKARLAHAEGAQAKAFRGKLQPLLRAPYDERPHTGLSVGASKPAGKGAVYVVTHVDIVPKMKEEGVASVKQLAEASRGDKGNLRYDALTQTSRPNHMTLVETWSDRKAVEAHGNAAHTVQFREKLTPMSGSLFDERLYHAMN